MFLREMILSDENEALKAHEELKADDFTFLLGYEEGMDWADYLDLHVDAKFGIDLPENLVAATFMVAESDGQLVGRVSIRHELNDFLLNYGGHIGYGVRPQFRKMGYATEILKQSLEYCREMGMAKVLVTCNDLNAPSAKTIEKCGGKLENTVTEKLDQGERLVRRYWIAL